MCTWHKKTICIDFHGSANWMRVPTNQGIVLWGHIYKPEKNYPKQCKITTDWVGMLWLIHWLVRVPKIITCWVVVMVPLLVVVTVVAAACWYREAEIKVISYVSCKSTGMEFILMTIIQDTTKSTSIFSETSIKMDIKPYITWHWAKYVRH